MRIILIAAALLGLSGCLGLGPDPGEADFQQAAIMLPEARDATYITQSTWYPNSMLADMFAFSNTATGGRMFLFEDKAIFAIFQSDRFYRTKVIDFADVEWMQHKPHGLVRVATFSLNNEIHSFILTDAMDMQGNSVNIDELVAWLAARVSAGKKKI